MADTIDNAHLVVEQGPDLGRRILVSPDGARIGRSSQNDIELTDGSISRFQCRVFFKPDGLLWIADLGSTNETLVNTQPVLETLLKPGDTIEIGETILRVISNVLDGTPATLPPPVPAPAPSQPAPHPESAPIAPPPAAFPPLAIGPEPDKPVEPAGIDLGLGEKPETGAARAARPAARRRGVWLVLVLVVIAVQVAIMASGKWRRIGGSGPQLPRVDDAFEIYFEKIDGSASNIFRYALTLEQGTIAVQIDSLTENRHVTREKVVEKDVLQRLATDLDRSAFFKLDESYQGLMPGVHRVADLTVTRGARTHRTAVVNRVEPEDFQKARELIEEFAKNELGLVTMSLPPERLIELARDATLQGQKLYGEREIRYDNLWKAIRSFEEAALYLETIEPKPDFHATVLNGLQTCRTELTQQYKNYEFLADKAIRMSDWREAAQNLRIMKELVPEQTDKRHLDADKKLLDVERRLPR